MARYGEDMGRERWRDDDRERSSYGRDRDDNRGFFERAGEEVRSWFSDDDHRDRDDRGSRSNWDREREMNRSGAPRGTFSGQGGRRDSWDNEDRSFFGGMSQGGSGNWDRNQERGGPGRSNERDGSSTRGFGGFRDESDFRGQHRQHRRDHPQSWGEANRGQNESLGYSEYSGSLGGFGNHTVGISEHDHYRSWRDREMAKLDKDYGDYCREREQKFNQDFDSWRTSRSSGSPSALSSASGSDTGVASNAGVGTTTASMTGSAGAGSALGSATGTGGSIQSDTTTSTETADTGGGRSGSRSRS